MAYNPYFPMNYPQPQNSGIIWVQGEAGAKSYMVAPNTTAQLWDSENQVIYLKSADASGMPSMRVLDYTIRDTQKPQGGVFAEKVDYPTREEFDALKRKIDALQAELGMEGKE